MRQEHFNLLMSDVASRWTAADGLVVLLRNPDRPSSQPVRLCFPASMNDLTPRNCVVWQGDSLLYEGEAGPELRSELTKRGVCVGEMRVPKDGSPAGGRGQTCYGFGRVCRRKCRARRQKQPTQEVTK